MLKNFKQQLISLMLTYCVQYLLSNYIRDIYLTRKAYVYSVR